jgi:hypothetical protein
MEKDLLKFLVIFSLLSLIPLRISAADDTIQTILTNIQKNLSTLGEIVAGIFIMIGGYQMLTSAGDPQKFETGKKTLLFAFVGFLVILIYDKIVDFIKKLPNP